MQSPRSHPTERTVVVVAPGILALPNATLARSTMLARLAALADRPHVESGGIEAATCAAVGYRGAPAPLAALGAGVDAAGGWVMHADPLHVEVGASDVVVGGRVDDLDADEARALAADIGELIEREGLRLEVARPERWFALSSDDAPCETVPVDGIVGRGLLGEVRRDEHARPLARMRGEIEMLLHEHPVNRARSERGAASVDDLWLWGGGRLSQRAHEIPALVIDACRGRAGDLARGLALASRGRNDAPEVAMTVVPPLRSDADLDALESDVLAVAIARLESHRIDELVLVADGGGPAATWRAPAPGLLQRVARRWRTSRFTRP